MKKILALSLLIVSGFLFYNLLSYQKHQNQIQAFNELSQAISKKQTDHPMIKTPAKYEISAEEMGDIFKNHTDWGRFISKVVKVEGTVKYSGKNDKKQYFITLQTSSSPFETEFIQCFISDCHAEFVDQISSGMRLTLKGKCKSHSLSTVIIEDCVFDLT